MSITVITYATVSIEEILNTLAGFLGKADDGASAIIASKSIILQGLICADISGAKHTASFEH